jgi:hypothetical protein
MQNKQRRCEQLRAFLILHSSFFNVFSDVSACGSFARYGLITRVTNNGRIPMQECNHRRTTSEEPAQFFVAENGVDFIRLRLRRNQFGGQR